MLVSTDTNVRSKIAASGDACSSKRAYYAISFCCTTRGFGMTRRRLSWLVVGGLVIAFAAWLYLQQNVASPPDARVYPIGANFFLEREVELGKRERTVQMAHDAGIRW